MAHSGIPGGKLLLQIHRSCLQYILHSSYDAARAPCPIREGYLQVPGAGKSSIIAGQTLINQPPSGNGQVLRLGGCHQVDLWPKLRNSAKH